MNSKLLHQKIRQSLLIAFSASVASFLSPTPLLAQEASPETKICNHSGIHITGSLVSQSLASGFSISPTECIYYNLVRGESYFLQASSEQYAWGYNFPVTRLFYDFNTINLVENGEIFLQ